MKNKYNINDEVMFIYTETTPNGKVLYNNMKLLTGTIRLIECIKGEVWYKIDYLLPLIEERNIFLVKNYKSCLDKLLDKLDIQFSNYLTELKWDFQKSKEEQKNKIINMCSVLNKEEEKEHDKTKEIIENSFTTQQILGDKKRGIKGILNISKTTFKRWVKNGLIKYDRKQIEGRKYFDKYFFLYYLKDINPKYINIIPESFLPDDFKNSETYKFLIAHKKIKTGS